LLQQIKNRGMTLLRTYRLTIIGILIGAIAGYAYYYFVGCASGTCPISSKPLNSTAYGAMMGALLFNSFEKDAQ
jgi:xanthine/uracil permease